VTNLLPPLSQAASLNSLVLQPPPPCKTTQLQRLMKIPRSHNQRASLQEVRQTHALITAAALARKVVALDVALLPCPQLFGVCTVLISPPLNYDLLKVSLLLLAIYHTAQDHHCPSRLLHIDMLGQVDSTGCRRLLVGWPVHLLAAPSSWGATGCFAMDCIASVLCCLSKQVPQILECLQPVLVVGSCFLCSHLRLAHGLR
jgi:hypothetical protein